MSALNIKAGFFNVPINPPLQRFAGLVAQDGLYVFLPMAFGFATAPAHFQGVMPVALSRSRRPLSHGTFMDDCTLGSDSVRGCWEDTMEAMRCLL